MPDYLLRIDGVNGDSTKRGFERWFNVASYEWEVDGTAGGRTTALPLSVTTLSLAGLVDVEKKAADGARIPTVELVALIAPFDANSWRLRLVLTNPVVASSGISLSGGADLSTQWSFGDYSRADITTRSSDGAGGFTAPVTATWRA